MMAVCNASFAILIFILNLTKPGQDCPIQFKYLTWVNFGIFVWMFIVSIMKLVSINYYLQK